MASRSPSVRRSVLRREEAAGLVVALAAHAALVVWLALKPPVPAPLPLPERMTVTFAEDVAERSTSPRPVAEAAPAVAPVIAPDPVPAPAPEPKPAVAKVQPKPEPPKPVAVVKPAPQPKPVVQPRIPARPQPAPAKPAPAKPAPAPAKAASAAARPAPPTRSGGGGSRLGADFLKGLPGGLNPAARDTTPPAQAIGPGVKAALSGAIARQLKPKWVAPQGAEADQLVTVLSWDLNPDGTLAGPPRLVSQSGVTDANRPQAQRHVEQAMRAVRLAAPFDLPDDLYAAWKHVAQFRFDRKLSQ